MASSIVVITWIGDQRHGLSQWVENFYVHWEIQSTVQLEVEGRVRKGEREGEGEGEREGGGGRGVRGERERREREEQSDISKPHIISTNTP